MSKTEPEFNHLPIGENTGKICDMSYIKESFGEKNNLIIEIIDTFISQVSEELLTINDAVEKIDFKTIRSTAHKMKTSVSIMGISSIKPILVEMEITGESDSDIKKLSELNHKLNSLCSQAIAEITAEKQNFC
ncbi:MAG: hypothetical protein A2W91_08380 [Bacteroidetes bacterium GWF2_38_335]|nr:MAG: hypothetical protein A2W91_08380 [Bacteroidetes bacterium GWF2_38_335]OFY78941.1 MAG: hypothetical protein A2281_02340 [Bacteroidetes bacterium RIFOXYA12_FULL_38_20]HBS86007.1 hypothetical protein [Bacteroidales bacterium]